MKWTQEQMEAISARGSDILVSAAAGSGKTAVLTERIKQLILSDGVSIDEMLVVTFSNAAAAEMREKILKSVSQAVKELTLNETDKELTAAEKTERRRKAEFLRVQLRKARTADISTFHKFSMNIIRNCFYLTDMESDFTICDEARRQIMQGEVLDDLMEERFASGGEEFLNFLRNYSDVKSEDRIRDMILSVYRFIMSMPKPFDWLSSACDALGADEEAFRASPVRAYIVERVRRSVEEAERMALRVCDMTAHLPSLLPKAQLDLERVSEIARLTSGDFDEDAVLEKISGIKFERFAAGKDDKAAYSEIKDIVGSMRDRMKKMLSSLQTEFFAVPRQEMIQRMNATRQPAEYLKGLVEEFHQRFTAAKRAKSLVDFNDIEHIALQILEHEEAAEEYRKHFRVIFVDEYQDSSILQETLIRRISRGDNVYMVGDVKQSIYKFRLAEPEIFIGKYNSFVPHPAGSPVSAGLSEAGPSAPDAGLSGSAPSNDPSADPQGPPAGRRIDLNRNFRCKGNIIRCVNGVFSSVMDRRRGGIDYDENAALKKGVSYEGELDRPVTLHLVDSTKADQLEDLEDIDEEIAELAKTEMEARVLAKLVSERIGQKIYDCKAETERTVEPGDIAVLLRGTKGTADIYAEALKNEGIPSYIDAGEGYFETMEIEVFMNLLRVIDNRRRDIPLLSVLRSPIFGLSVKELIQIRLAHRTGSYSEAFLASEDEKCAAVREKLDRWRLKARYMPLEEFLWMLLRESGYMEYASALPGGDRRAANLRALVDKAVIYSGSQGQSLFGFVRYVESLSQNQVATGQSSGSFGAENTVRIMTIHKSKGLEFPVVMTAGLGRRFNRDRGASTVTMQKEFGLGLRYADADRNCYAKTVVQRVIEQKKEEERLAEEMRILYVAMTRAMDELVLIGSLNKLEEELENYSLGLKGADGEAQCFLDWIVPNMKDAGIQLICHDRHTLSSEVRQDETVRDAFRQELETGFADEEQDEELFRLISERFSFRYPYEDDVFTKSKFTVSGLNRLIRGEETAYSGMPAGLEMLQAEEPEEFLTSEEDILQEIPTMGDAAAFEAQISLWDLLSPADEADAAGMDTDAAGLSGEYGAFSFSQDLSALLDEKISDICLTSKKGDDDVPAAKPLLSENSCADMVPEFLKEETPVTAAMRGTIMHKVMELIPFSEDIDEKKVREFTDSLVEKNILSEKEADAVSAKQITSFFRTDTGKRACRARWIRREWPFTLKKKREELTAMAESREDADRLRSDLPPELLIQGIIDLCFEDDDGIAVVDYKTDYIDFHDRQTSYDEIRRRYEKQVALYRDVIRTAFDTDRIETKLFLFRTGEIIEV